MKTIIGNGLEWQTNGIQGTHAQAEDFIETQNEQKVNGFNNWRLPTLEEAMAMINTEKNHRHCLFKSW